MEEKSQRWTDSRTVVLLNIYPIYIFWDVLKHPLQILVLHVLPQEIDTC